MTAYLVVLEQAPDGGWGAYVPDLPGCTSWGETRDDAARHVREAIEGHIRVLELDGDPVPAPTSSAEMVEVGRALRLT
jgi:predicted RNase H-like HicB family nuclease